MGLLEGAYGKAGGLVRGLHDARAGSQLAHRARGLGRVVVQKAKGGVRRRIGSNNRHDVFLLLEGPPPRPVAECRQTAYLAAVGQAPEYPGRRNPVPPPQPCSQAGRFSPVYITSSRLTAIAQIGRLSCRERVCQSWYISVV